MAIKDESSRNNIKNIVFFLLDWHRSISFPSVELGSIEPKSSNWHLVKDIWYEKKIFLSSNPPDKTRSTHISHDTFHPSHKTTRALIRWSEFQLIALRNRIFLQEWSQVPTLKHKNSLRIWAVDKVCLIIERRAYWVSLLPVSPDFHHFFHMGPNFSFSNL